MKAAVRKARIAAARLVARKPGNEHGATQLVNADDWHGAAYIEQPGEGWPTVIIPTAVADELLIVDYMPGDTPDEYGVQTTHTGAMEVFDGEPA